MLPLTSTDIGFKERINMSKTITLDTIQINYWSVDVGMKRVTVSYNILQDTGEVFKTADAFFWETIPDPISDLLGNPIPNPDNWYQLPPEYSALLTDLTLDVRAALLHLIN